MLHNRPISPHLQIYNLPLTALLSISHRVTGVLLIIGLLGLVLIAWQLSLGGSSFYAMQSQLNSPLFSLLNIGCLYAFVFHFCHGIRHLIWDMGSTFSREKLTYYALCEIAASVSLTVLLALELK